MECILPTAARSPITIDARSLPGVVLAKLCGAVSRYIVDKDPGVRQCGVLLGEDHR